MKELESMYEDLGVSRAVYAYGEKILEDLKPRFAGIDRNAEYNQAKVLHAMQENRVDATCFAATTGYGYDDLGRDKLEKVYAATFHTEAALVRPQITCGTHALAVALSANLLPGDELLSPVGAPYDTLEEVIGIRESKCSLKEYGVSYRQVDLLPDGSFDYDGIRAAITEKTKQKSGRWACAHWRVHLRHKGMCRALLVPALGSRARAGGRRESGPASKPLSGLLPCAHGCLRRAQGRDFRGERV